MYIIQRIGDLFTSIGARWRHWQYERKCIKYFGAKPETIYLSKDDFDSLIQRLNEPSDPKSLEKLKELMNRTSPWENEST